MSIANITSMKYIFCDCPFEVGSQKYRSVPRGTVKITMSRYVSDGQTK